MEEEEVKLPNIFIMDSDYKKASESRDFPYEMINRPVQDYPAYHCRERELLETLRTIVELREKLKQSQDAVKSLYDLLAVYLDVDEYQGIRALPAVVEALKKDGE